MKEDRPNWIYIVSLLVFIGLIFTSYVLDVKDYINDGVIIIFLLSLVFFAWDSLKLRSWVYLLIAFGFLLHNLGVFGFYNISPVFIQWDHVTHFFGELAMGVFVFNYLYRGGVFSGDRLQTFYLCTVAVLAAMGLGVFVEFLEFGGYFFIGEGAGVLGHGLGDINTEFINSEWFNTMFDLIYNFIGAVVGVTIAYFVSRIK